MLDNITPIILAGGQGRRLSPLTAPHRPKPLLHCASPHNLLQETLLRFKPLAPPIIICPQPMFDAVKASCKALKITPRAIVIEPASRSTAPAITLAAQELRPSETMLVTPSDHYIDQPHHFLKALPAAYNNAKHHETIISFGAPIKRPSSRYGYIEAHNTENISKIIKFHEKPDLKTAKNYKNAQNFLWNTGIFLSKQDNFIKNMQKHAPHIMKNIKNNYKNTPAEAIDTALMEKCEQSSVMKIPCDWEDIGTKSAFFQLYLKRLFLSPKNPYQ